MGDTVQRTPSPAADSPVTSSEPLPAAAGSGAELSFASVLALMERLADVLDAPPSATDHASAELEAVVCGFIARLRASGASPDDIAARLTRMVHGASGDPSCDRTAAQVAAVTAWCERDMAA